MWMTVTIKTNFLTQKKKIKKINSSYFASLHFFGCHDDNPCVLLPDHSPEIDY